MAKATALARARRVRTRRNAKPKTQPIGPHGPKHPGNRQLCDKRGRPDASAHSRGNLANPKVATFCAAIWLTFTLPLTKIKTASYFLKIFTAWAVCMYIDDYLVLYDIVQYPDTGLVKVVFALRPFVITALAWMCLELDFRVKNGY